LLAELDRRGMTSPKGGRRSDTMRERIRAGDNHHFLHPDESSAQLMDPRTLSKAVDAILPADRVVASDSGHFCGWVPRYLRVPNARASCLSHSFQLDRFVRPSRKHADAGMENNRRGRNKKHLGD
jgi:thiamine pyrophosphate-dependent acetolactate synthase large subunit-like protein